MADDWERLAAMARKRREDLGLTREQIAAAGGPSATTQQHIEAAKQPSYRPVTLRKLEQALGWELGSVRAVLDGGAPSPAVTAGTAAAAGAATATATATAAAADADPLSWIGQAIAEEMFAVEDGVWAEIRAGRRRGTPEARIFADPDEQAMWSVPVTPEEQRAANIAALRYWRRTLPPRRASTPAALAG